MRLSGSSGHLVGTISVFVGFLFISSFATQILASTSSKVNILIIATQSIPPTLKISNITLSLNSTDHSYHLNGKITNLINETISNPIIAATFEDKVTNIPLRSLSGFVNTLNPGQTINFDINSGYNMSQTNQFKSMKVTMNS